MVLVNIVPGQDDKVLPFLKENRYTFDAYKGNPDIVQNYGVSGVPSEFVIDPAGRVLGKLRLNNDERASQFEQLLETLLK